MITSNKEYEVKGAIIVHSIEEALEEIKKYPAEDVYCIFIVYSIAYGINEGLLDKEIYLPVMIKGWNALVSAVEPNGKLGYVQQIGADPKKVTRDMTEVYGVGAFLMAGNEIYKMAR